MYKISGKIIHGEHFGKILGFPTANIERRGYVQLRSKPKLGVWSGVAQVPGLLKKAGIVIGPIDKKGLPKIEAHLIGFKGNLYGKKITLILQRYLRPFKKYKNIGQLKEQIKKDIKLIKKLSL